MSSCSYDSLCINGVKFCGNWTKDRVFQYIVPADSSFTLDFKTDGSATYRGFQVSTLDCPEIIPVGNPREMGVVRAVQT